MDNVHIRRRNVTSRIHSILSRFGLENAVSGGKFDNLKYDLSPSDGYWSSKSTQSKPPRLLLHLKSFDNRLTAQVPVANTSGAFAYANTAKRSVGGLSVRIQVVVAAEDEYRLLDEWEWLLWFVFWPALENGTSGKVFNKLQPEKGTFEYCDKNQDYLEAGLVLLNDKYSVTAETDESGEVVELTYLGVTNAIRDLFQIRGQRIAIYDAAEPNDMHQMESVITKAFDERISVKASEASDAEESEFEIKVDFSGSGKLIGIREEVYRQINSAIRNGFRHFMIYGPPGTGKTTLAQDLAGFLSPAWNLVTGSADFSSQDILGGYMPTVNGGLIFRPGLLLQHFDSPFIFDELNRCDIDKVIGPLFTMLSGHSTTLPYLCDPNDTKSERVRILPQAGVSSPPAVFAPSSKWRLIATINSIDKASLYQMSYALTRRFAWIFLDIPEDLGSFLQQILSTQLNREVNMNVVTIPSRLWAEINKVRPIGPAPILDLLRVVMSKPEYAESLSQVDDPSLRNGYLDGFYMFVLPMLDGILLGQANDLAENMATLLELTGQSRDDLERRIRSISI